MTDENRRVTCKEASDVVFEYRGASMLRSYFNGGKPMGGYDEDEVDKFLDRVADTLAAHQRDRSELLEMLYDADTSDERVVRMQTILKRETTT